MNQASFVKGRDSSMSVKESVWCSLSAGGWGSVCHGKLLIVCGHIVLWYDPLHFCYDFTSCQTTAMFLFKFGSEVQLLRCYWVVSRLWKGDGGAWLGFDFVFSWGEFCPLIAWLSHFSLDEVSICHWIESFVYLPGSLGWMSVCKVNLGSQLD